MVGYWGQANSDEGAFFNVIQVLGGKKAVFDPGYSDVYRCVITEREYL